MNALVFRDREKPLELVEMSVPQPGKGDVLLSMEAAALNHRDVWISKGLYPRLRSGVVLGSDGVGRMNGKSYIINPNQSWGTHEGYASSDYSILGMPQDGTFAQYLAVPRNRLVPKPAHLTIEEAAALPLAGLTAYRALFKKCHATAEDRVLVSGIGGGVALFACQFALALGAEVWVTSSSPDKIEQAIQLGAVGGALYSEPSWEVGMMEESQGFDVFVDGSGGEGFSKLIALARPGARIAIYGGTAGKIAAISPQQIFWKQIQILGTTMGSDHDFDEMVTFVQQHKIKPVIDSSFLLQDWQPAFRRMERGQQFGKIVLMIS